MLLPVERMVLYKHGVGFVERRKSFSGNQPIKLTFKREEMDDILKSLSIFDTGDGKVTGVSYETAEDVSALLAEKAISVPEREALVGLMRQLRGYEVRVTTPSGEIGGIVMGTQEDSRLGGDGKIAEPMASLVLKDQKEQIVPVKVADIMDLTILSTEAREDLDFFLDAVTSERKKSTRAVTIFLDGKVHDVSVSYIVSMPSWRVSYRVAFSKKRTVLQGWGIIDNRLDEDLKDVKLSLVAGKPISFIYDIYTPRIVPRPIVREEVRNVAAPVEMESGLEEYDEEEMEDYMEKEGHSGGRMKKAMAAPMEMASRSAAPPPGPTVDAFADSADVQTRTVQMGEFFKYDIDTPVTVKRGQSAMVPIIQCSVTCEKEHVFNSSKMPVNPVVTLKITNDSGAVLERGPILVLDGGTYVGEAILPYTTNDAVNNIAYSIDLGVEVTPESSSGSDLREIHIADRYFEKVYLEWTETVYRVKNKKIEGVDLVVEHPKGSSGLDMDVTKEPIDETDGFYRWKFRVKPKSSSEFLVREITDNYYSEYIRDMSRETLKSYYSSKFISKANFEKAGEVIEIQEKIHKLEEESERLAEEENNIEEAQERLRDNIGALGDTQKENTLRARYVDKLDAGETRIEKIGERREKIQHEIDAIEKVIDSKLKAIRDDGGPSGPGRILDRIKKVVKKR